MPLVLTCMRARLCSTGTRRSAEASTMPDLVIDLSHWNTVKDFAAVKAAGIVGVIHKCTEGDGYADPTYDNRADAARAAGLLWGAYHFLRPGDMAAQARYFVAHADDTATLLAA